MEQQPQYRQTDQQLQPQPQIQPQSTQPAPLYRTDMWCLPDGQFGLWNYRKAEAIVYPGWLMIYRKSDHAELKRIHLAPDLEIKNFLNYARISQLSGQKYSMFNQKYSFFLVTMWSYAVFLVGVLVNLINSLIRFNTVYSGGEEDLGLSLTLQSIGLLFMIAALIWMATGYPKGKALAAACKHAASIA